MGRSPHTRGVGALHGWRPMTEYAVSTNLMSWGPARVEQTLFGWPSDGPEADVVRQMGLGDELVLK